jgi:WD40 repeat protein
MKMLKELPENDGAIRDVLWSNDGSRFMLAGGNWVTKKTHYIYDAENGSTKFIVNTKYKSTAEFSGSSPVMMTVERNLSYRKKDIVKVWNSETGELLHDLEFPYKTNSLWSLFSPSGEHIIVIDRMNRTDIFDTKTGKLFKTLDFGKDVFPTPSYVAFSPDGKKMLVGVWKFRGILKEKETWFRIYNTETFDLIGELKTEKSGKHQVELHQVVWRPDSRSVIAAGERYHSEYEAEAWNLDTFNQQYVLTTLIAKKTRALFEGGYDYFDRMEFTADSKYLVTTNRGKTKILRVWDADTGKLLISSDRIDGLFQLTSDQRYVIKTDFKENRISLYKISL